MYYKNTFRVLSHEDMFRLKTVNGVLLQATVPNIVTFKSIDAHLLDRSRDRGIDVDIMLLVISYTVKQRLSDILSKLVLYTEPFIKFAIQYDKDFFIHVTCKNYPDRRIITFHTVIPYRDEYDIETFCIKIGKLIRK